MLFSIGYQIDEKQVLVPEIINRKAFVREVYFSFGDFANGRNRITDDRWLTALDAQQRQSEDLQKLHAAGIALNLLLNGNCYGADSLSRAFFNRVGDTVDYLIRNYEISSVTTASPVIADFLRRNFPELELRFSVNMGIGEPHALSYIEDLFDSFYLKREYNRNLPAIRRARQWCDEHGKKMFMLANSGCLNDCPIRNFHDNLVAHEDEIMARDNALMFKSVCKEYLKDESHRGAFLRHTNFVRPEDIHLYEGLFDGAKLATRVNRNPVQILRAYTDGTYIGNLAELLEPDHAAVLYPYVIENKMLPADFGEQVMTCNKDCKTCHDCDRTLERALQKIDEGVTVYAEQ